VRSRHLPIGGTHNFRDVGGYPVAGGGATRWRTLFRTDSLHKITQDGERALRDLGVRSFIDLRGHPEVAALPSMLASSSEIRYIHHPLASARTRPGNPQVTTVEELNRVFLDDCQEAFAELLTLMAAPGVWPSIVSCYVGKDRTGLVTALLLELAGVSRETIVEDYALTCRYAAQLMPALRGGDANRYRLCKSRTVAAGTPMCSA